MKNENEKKDETSTKLVKVTPKKDHVIAHNEYFYDLKEGVTSEVHPMFIPNLKTENVL